MKNWLKVAGAAVLVLAGALPVAADVTTMTCADFSALDAVTKKSTADEMLKWLSMSENSTKMPNLVGKYVASAGEEAWTPDTFVIEIEGHCKDADPTMGVLARLNEHS